MALLAGLMRGFAGFDSAMLMAPIYAMLLGSADMVVTVLAIELIVSFQFFTQVREDADAISDLAVRQAANTISHVQLRAPKS